MYVTEMNTNHMFAFQEIQMMIRMEVLSKRSQRRSNKIILAAEFLRLAPVFSS